MIKLDLSSVPAYRKAIVAWVGAAVILLTSASVEFSSLIPEDAAKWVNVLVAALTAVSVFLVKNARVIDDAGKLGG